jgi:dihydrofolate reductase
MGKLVVTEFITLDGVAEDPGGSEGSPYGGWAFQFDRGAEGDRFKLEELRESDAQLLGRRTYEGFAAAWPAMNEDEFGRKMNTMPKHVVSSTLTSPAWENTEVVQGGLGEVAALKKRYDGNLLVAGSLALVQGLLAAGLVDELRLMVFPVVAGGGKRLFPEGLDRLPFELLDARRAGETSVMTFKTQSDA